MEILVCLLVISNVNLVFTEDLASEKAPALKDGFKVQPEKEGKESSDQLAESSQSIGQAYGNAVAGGTNLKQDGTQRQAEPSQQLADVVVHGVDPQNGLRHDVLSLNPIQVIQSHQEYVQPQHQQQLYLHPVQIYDVEALPLQQTYQSEGPQALGYSSYVEHMSEKDEDEINSALKEGSVSDIKRLVPKSGISFKIYHSEKNPETQTPEAQVPIVSKTPAGFSTLHHRIRSEVTAAPHKAQHDVHQTLAELQPTTPRSEDRGGYRNSQQLLQSHGQGHQEVNPQQVYYTQPDSHKTLVEVNSKSSFVRPNFKINVGETSYNRQTTGAEVHQNLKLTGKSSKQSFNDVGNQKLWNFAGKTENLRAVKPLKPLEPLHYATDSLAHIEKGKAVAFTQNAGHQNLNKHRPENSFEANQGAFNYHSGSYIAKTSQTNHFVGGQSANAPHSDQKVVLNRLTGNYVSTEGLKPGQVIGHPGTSLYAENAFKSGRFAVTDSEPAKTSQHGLVSHAPKTSYVDTKNSQTFDHQKALEGSTSFDIKNAIDTTGALVHQTNYVAPTTTEIHPLENTPKQQLTYIISEIPTSTVVIDNGIHDAADGHQFKEVGHAGIAPQLPFHPDAGGKLYHPPQNFVWTTEHLKQGVPPSFTPKDLHQQVIRLHLPKEEVFVKTPNVEFPTSVVSHVSIPHQKQPFAFHYDLPFVKTIPQDLHFQPKTKTRVPANQHLKLTQPVTIDWSLFKSGLANYGMNVVGIKHELPSHVQEPGKKIIPILVRKRKNRSNGKEIGVVYGKVNAGRRPVKPNNRQEKNAHVNLLAEANGANMKQFDTKGERKNEFSVSASYKVDRSSQSS